MKHFAARAISFLLVGGCALSAAWGAGKAQAAASNATPNEKSVTVAAAEPCTLAHILSEKLGILAPNIRSLPNSQAFGAANGRTRTVVACRLTDDEAFTYDRLLSFAGVGLLSFKGDETPQQVVQALARQLGLPAERLDPSPAELPLNYRFSDLPPYGRTVRLAVVAATAGQGAQYDDFPPAATAREANAAKTLPPQQLAASRAPQNPHPAAKSQLAPQPTANAQPVPKGVVAAAGVPSTPVAGATASAPRAAAVSHTAPQPVAPAQAPADVATAQGAAPPAAKKGAPQPVAHVAAPAPGAERSTPPSRNEAQRTQRVLVASALPVVMGAVAPAVAALSAPPVAPATPAQAAADHAAPLPADSRVGRAAPLPAGNPDPPAPTVVPVKNFWELYLLARSHDPEVGRSEARLAGSKADVDLTFSGLLPRIGADAGITFIDQTILNYQPTEQHSTVLGRNYDVTARMPLLSVPSLFNVAASSAGQRSEEAGVSVARQNLMVRFTDAFFGVLKAQADQEIAKEEIGRLRQVLEQANSFLKAGTGDIIAVYEAQARLDSVIADLNRSDSSLRLAEQRLAAIVGREVTAVTSQLPQHPVGPVPEDLDWWLATMEKRDPQVRQAREGLVQTQQLRKAAKAEHLPVLEASAGYNVNRGSAFLPNVETHQWSAGATISIPIYSGGETSARIRRAVANEAERGFVLDQVLEQRRDNLRQSYFNLGYNASLIKALEQKKNSAEVQLNAVKKGRSIGTRTAIDLLNAEEAYAIADRDLRNALYDNVVRAVQLKSAAGVLSEGDLTAIAGIVRKE